MELENFKKAVGEANWAEVEKIVDKHTEAIAEEIKKESRKDKRRFIYINILCDILIAVCTLVLISNIIKICQNYEKMEQTYNMVTTLYEDKF